MENRISNTVEKREPAGQNLPAQALEQLRLQHLEAKQVRRVAIGRQGLVHIELEDAGEPRFFAYRENVLRELEADKDWKIPLLEKLHRSDAPAYRLISYRPGRRIVIETSRDEHEEIIKGYKKCHAARAAKKFETARTACAGGGFDLPVLLAVNTEDDYLVMLKSRGQTPGITANFARIWTRIGACLRQFQQSRPSPGLESFDAGNELAVLDERAKRYRLYVGDFPDRWQEGYRRLVDAALKLPRVARGLAHRDLHDKQFIITEKSATLLDFDLLCTADTPLDAGNLLAHLRLRELQRGHGDAQVCSRAFLNGLDRQEEGGFVQGLYFYQAATFYRLALLYALRPRWAHLVDDLINEGQGCLDMFDNLGEKS